MHNKRERGGTGVVDGVRASLAHHLPGYEVRSMVELGKGSDNAAYEVNGELVVRVSKEADARRRSEATRREAELLAAVARFSTLPVPEPVFADAEAGVLAYFKLPGLPLMDRPVEEPARLAPALGGFVGRLHRAPLGEIEPLVQRDFYPLTAWLEDAERYYRRVAQRVPAADRRLIEDFLGSTPPAEPGAEAFGHNDLGAEHVLVDVGTGAVTGVIDWTDAAIADPARDLALIYRDLGSKVFDLALAHYGGRFNDADRGRAAFYARCKLLEDVAYGLGTPGAARYAMAGLAHLERTFA
jgi:aminoglycoside phosphotransferase (APT) family kinase protein